jgi:hypothetical protein
VFLLTWGRNNDSREGGYLYRCDGKLSPTGIAVLQLLRDINGIKPKPGDARDTLSTVIIQNVLSLSPQPQSLNPHEPFVTPPDALRRLAAKLYWKGFANLKSPPAFVVSSGAVETQVLYAISGLKVIACTEMEQVLANDLGKKGLRHEYDAETLYADQGGVDPRSIVAVLRLPGSSFSFLHR